MADELAVEFFKAARSQVSQVARWHLIILAALLYFHLAIVAPFAAKTAEKLALDRDIAAREAVRDAILPVSAMAKQLGDHVANSAQAVSNDLLDDLVGRFATLNRIVAALSAMDEDAAAGEPGRELFRSGAPEPSGQAPFAQMQMNMAQMPLNMAQSALPGPAPAGDFALEPMEPDLARMVVQHTRDPDGPVGYSHALETYAGRAVVQPAFDKANAAWREQYLPTIDRDAQAALAAADGAAARSGAASGEIAQLRHSIETLAARARALQFVPPADPRWWRTVPGKAESIESMRQDLDAGVRDAAHSQLRLDAFLQDVNGAIATQDALAKAVVAEIDRLDEQAKALQEQLGELGSPLKIVAFRLSVLAPLLPVIVAAASGIATLLTANALRRMCLAVSLTRSPEQRAELRPWLAEAAGGDRARLTVRWVLATLGVGGWIIATLVATRSLEPLFIPNAAMAGLALAFFIGCRAWLWHQSGEALRLAGVHDAPAAGAVGLPGRG